jgi:hypothetical protein
MVSRTRLARRIATVVLALLVIVAVGRIVSNASQRRRQAGFRDVVAMYSRDLQQGATREDVERYIGLHGGRPASDSQPDFPDPRDILVQLGEEPAPWYCSRQIAYVRLKFDDANRYRSASLKTEDQDCM